MLKAALIGVGAMGGGHLNNYHRLMREGKPVELAAICDIDPKRLYGREKTALELGTDDKGAGSVFGYRRYLDIDEMLEKEELDYVDIALPTFLHAPVAIKCMERGLHVFCEKPMALWPEDCQTMIDCARRTGRTLMVGQCLRFWPAYEYLKETVESGRYGKAVSANFFRGGNTPTNRWENWMMDPARSGGCMVDQHIHDADIIQWVFGKPDRVSAAACRTLPGSLYDACSVHYFYDDLGAAITAQNDWTLNGEFKFTMGYRVNFERGLLVWDGGEVTDYPHDGKKFIPELASDDGYYREMVSFIEAVNRGEEPDRIRPESARNTVILVRTEIESANRKGAPVDVVFPD